MKHCFLLFYLWNTELVQSFSFHEHSITTSGPTRNSDSSRSHSASILDDFTPTKQKVSTASYCPNIFMPSKTSNDWEQFCPPLLPTLLSGTQDQPRYSASVQWSPHNEQDSLLAAELAARELLSQIAPNLSSSLDERLVQALQSYMTDFYHFCNDHFDYEFQLQARMVASRGTSGTSCPLWHIDKVPVRWIQALVGPGCQVVKSEEGINWDAFDENSNMAQELMGMSTAEENQSRVDSKTADIYSANTNEVTMLVGDRWNELSSHQQLKPIVHRSPSSIPSGRQDFC